MKKKAPLSDENEAKKPEKRTPKNKKSQATDVSLHPIRRVLFHFICYVSIHVQGECDCSMPQILRDRLDVIAVLKTDSCVCMTEVMETNMTKAYALQYFLQVFVYGHAAKMMSQFIGENQIQIVVESLTST